MQGSKATLKIFMPLWIGETNPPINGFYETMMSLTPERRKALRLEAERHRQEQLKKSGVKDTLNPAFVPSSDNKPEQKEAAQQPEAQPEATPVPVTDYNPSEQATTSLFPEFEPEKPKEEVIDLSPVRSTVCWSRTTVTARWCWTLPAISAT